MAVVAGILASCGGSPRSGTGVIPISLPTFKGCTIDNAGFATDIAVPVRVIRPAPGNAIITVGVCVNGEGPFPFVVDTGASATVIDSSLAARLHLPTFDAHSGSSFGCTRTISLTTTQRLSMDGLHLDPQVVVVGTIRSPLIPGLMGAIGSDVLSRFDAARFDFQADTLTLAGPEGPPISSSVGDSHIHLDATMRAGTNETIAASTQAQSAPIPDHPGDVLSVVRVHVQVAIAGQRWQTFLVDTGATRTFLAPALAASADLEQAGDPFAGYAGYDCRVRISTYKLNSWSIDSIPLAPAIIYSSVLPPGQDGLLGAGTLQLYTPVVIDYRDSDLLLANDKRP